MILDFGKAFYHKSVQCSLKLCDKCGDIACTHDCHTQNKMRINSK